MKKQLISCLLLLFITCNVFSQSNNSNNSNLTNLCKVWGFLKYYHPQVAKGKIDWDSVLIKLITDAKKADKERLNSIYLGLLQQLEPVSACKNCNTFASTGFTKNLDLKWLDDYSILNRKIAEKLKFILENRKPDSNYYVTGSPYFEIKGMANAFFVNEKKYKQMRLPSYEYRLLSLFRFWNIINYYYPYKYSLKENWNNVLKKMIPIFEKATDTLLYHKALQQLVFSIHDSHSDFTTRKLEAEYGEYRAPFYCKIIEGKAVVTKLLFDSLCKTFGIKIGDIVEEWDGEKIADRIKRFSTIIPASNNAVRVRDICFRVLLATNKELVTARIVKNGKTVSVNIICIKKQEAFMKQLSDDSTFAAWKKINDAAGYVNFEKITEPLLDSMMLELKNCKAIIFDLRHYPKDGSWFSIIQNYIYPNKRNFAKVLQPDYLYPGVFKILSGEDALWENAGNENNNNYYKGKVIVLVNEETQSQGETAALAFKAGPNTILIGTGTSGTNGDISEIPLVGGMSANMSGLGFFYPDGKEIQRIGMMPNIKITQTVYGIRNGKDEILEAAIQYVAINLK